MVLEGASGSPAPTQAQARRAEIPIGISRREVFGRDPRVALGLAILVGLAVFFLLWRIRKTFGMKE